MEGVDEIVREFLVESHENLDQLDSDLVALESSPGSRDLLASIFRTIHTIKGTSGFLAFGKLERLTHVGESLLAELRDGKRTMDQTAADALLHMVDAVRALLTAIETKGGEGPVEVDAVVAELQAVLDGRAAPAAAKAPVKVAAGVGAKAPAAPPAAAPPAAVAAPPTPPAAEAPAPSEPTAPAADAAAAAPARTPRIKRTAAVPRPSEPVANEVVPPEAAALSDAALAALDEGEAEWTPTFDLAPAATAAPEAHEQPTDVAPDDDAADPEPQSAPAPQPEEAPVAVDTAPAHVTPPAGPPAAESVPAAETGTFRGAADQAIRVDVAVLDALMRQVSELVLARNAIARLAEADGRIDLARASQRLSLVAGELQEGVMKTRMQPIEHVWSKVPRMVRDLAASCGRQVRLEMTGGDTELDRSLLEAIKDPLTHLVRNAVDHGIEPPTIRTGAGKPATGVVTLRAYHAGGQVVVEVSDDGAGINPDRVGATAVRKGLRTQEQINAMPPAEILRLLFLPGFSTATAVTNVSGRGVGMDVVRTRIEAIGGTVDVDSVVGKGTTWRMRIPLTLAIMPAVLVACDSQTYALPQSSLLELVALDDPATAVEYVHSAPVYRLRGELLPLVDLREVLELPARSDGAGVVVAVLQADNTRFGLVVDRVLDSEEIVVKPLAAQLKAIGLYAGATLLGDGAVALILDVPGLVRRAMVVETEDSDMRSGDETAATSTSEQLLVVGIGGDRRVAIPLAEVTRLEKLPADVLEVVGGREVVQYRGAITPLVRLPHVLGTYADTDGELTVIVATRGARSVAIAVTEIVDIVEDDGSRHSDVAGDVLVGSAVLKDRVTELLDVRAVVSSADPHFFDSEDLSAADAVADLVGV